MEDNKIYHIYENVNTTIVDIIEKKLGKLSRTTGKKHTFLGIYMNCFGSRKVKITTRKHVEESMENLKEEVKKMYERPQKNLFIVHIKLQPLYHEKTERFNQMNEK